MWRTAIGNGFEEIWHYRVPFISIPQEDYFGYAGDEHSDIELDDRAERWLDTDRGDPQGHVIFHPEHGEVIAWPQNEYNRTPDYISARAEQIKEFARARWEESLNGGWNPAEDEENEAWNEFNASVKTAMPWDDNVWYHVTDRSRLPQIQQQGLVGSEQGTERVWGEFPVEEGAVYLWPNIGGAYGYANGKMTGGGQRWQDPVILRVKGIDKKNLAPDHESAMENWQDSVYYNADDSPDYAERKQWLEDWAAQNPLEPEWEDKDHRDYRQNIRKLRDMPTEYRVPAAEEQSRLGDTVMHYGPIHPHQIDVGHVLDLRDGSPGSEESWERWQEENPQEWTQEQIDNGEDVDAYDTWLSDQPHIGEEDGQTLDNWYDDPEDDSMSSYWDWTPLVHYKHSNSPGVDSWTTPSNTHTNVADPVGDADGLPPTMPKIPCYCDVGLTAPHEWRGSCENGQRPTMRYEAAFGSNWVYIEGQVEFGRHWFQIAQEMLINQGADEETTAYVTNMLARNTLPTDMDIAIGSTRNGRVQIWESTLDRNAVWDAVSAAKAQQV